MSLTLRIEGTGAVPGGTDSVAMAGEALTIGRSADNDLVLPDPERVISSRHCVLEMRNGDFILIDISTNGTFVNYSPEAVGPTPLPLNNGDVISVGRYELRVEIGGVAPPADPFAGLPPPAETGPIVSQSPQRAGQDPGFLGSLDDPGAGGADFLEELLGDAPAGPRGRAQPEPEPLPPELFEDPLAAPRDEPVQGASFSNHNPSTQDHFAPPPVQAPLIPDDWDEEFGGGPGPGSDPFRPPAGQPPARPPVSPGGSQGGSPGDPFAPPPGPAPHIPPEADPFAPPDADPFAPPGEDPFAPPPPRSEEAPPDLPPGPVRPPQPQAPPRTPPAPHTAEAYPADPHPATAQQPPVRQPPVQQPPIQQPPAAQAPPRPAARPSAEQDAALAFLRAAGVDPGDMSEAELQAAMARLGETFRILVSGLREVLIARAAIKNEFRLTQTVISVDGNNPFKFSVSADHAMESMLRPSAGYLPAPAAAEEAIGDIKAHEVAMMTGMQAAIDGLLKRFDPERLSGRIERSGLSSLLTNRKARLWDQFEVLYGDIAREAEDDFQALFGKEFARAYQAQLKKL